MTSVLKVERSRSTITIEDLAYFAKIAKNDREDFFRRHITRKDNFLCAALCQGGAMHYLDGSNGVKDIDLWCFYAASSETADYPVRRRVTYDLGRTKFGVHPDDAKNGFEGRRVDILGRSIHVKANENAIEAVRRYLMEGKTQTAWALRQKPVVLIDPAPLIGTIVWPNGEP